MRLKGTNSEEARKMIEARQKDLGLVFNDDFDSAAKQVVKIAKT